jgi:hypothetical protein
VDDVGQPSLDADLFEYGILTEASDIRAHVSVVNQTIYVFPTENGRAAVRTGKYRLVPAGQPGVDGATATGWIVPPDDIEDMRKLRYASWPQWCEFVRVKDDTTTKGSLAVRCVVDAMRLGRFPFWLHAAEDDRENVQIAGTDIVVFCRKRVQVKCDWAAGDKPMGTGHLFLQKSERNPLKKH